MLKVQNAINGQYCDAVSAKTLENGNPATGAVYGSIPDSDERDIELAVQAARAAFDSWSKTPATERSRIMLAIADGLEARLEEFVLAESNDNGKPVAVARAVDIPRSVQNFRFFASAILHESSQSHTAVTPPLGGHALNYTLRQPYGVCGLISPWNLPLYVFTWKIAPALATGNTVVAKPSEVTPVTAYMFAEVCNEAGLPPGVLNIVHGLGPKVGSALSSHPDVPVISFTGGTLTGQSIAATAAPMFKKLSLELGGKNPNIIFADADIEAALHTSLRTSFANQGQICLCGSRLLVEQSIHDDFVQALSELTQELNVGDPLDDQTQFGALVSKAQLEKVTHYVELAKQDGGHIVCGGRPPITLPERVSDGYFFEPTIITGLAPTAAVNQEEIFGPVVSVIPFKDEAEALAIANGTAYGLSASIWTKDFAKAHRMADRLQAGTVWINSWMLRDLRVPFGGYKQSGVGREGGWDSLRFFTETKNVCLHIPE